MKGHFAFLWILLFLFYVSLGSEELTDEQWLESTDDIQTLAEVLF